MDAVGELLTEVERALPRTRQELRRLKTRLAGRAGGGLVANDALLERYRGELERGARGRNQRLERVLMLNAVRSTSGIATITVITEPYACPGRCVYCPTEARAPKSYLVNEPAMMRAVRNDYDPYRQMTDRLRSLRETGHATDKIELIIKGGTWSFYPERYQEEFITRCLEAANESGAEAALAGTLDEAMGANETADSRIIGVTIETRPDYVTGEEILRLRRLGVTRVELGIQILDDRVLELIVRDHGTAEIRQATRLLKEAGFKVAYHIMPNLPGATSEDDLRAFDALFSDPAYRPDALKLYPCVVIKSAELYDWWREGRYQPYSTETLVELLIEMKRRVPPYVRIERVIRDIPATSIEAGCHLTNLREEAQRRMRERGMSCRCIRCRQVREQTDADWELNRMEYDSAGGREVFLSFEDPSRGRLASLLRLRGPGSGRVVPPIDGAALIRELHTYGHHVRLREQADDAAQHHGFGRRLIAEAEQIARQEWGCRRMAVIAGVGVREYYRRLGYRLLDTYMVKTL